VSVRRLVLFALAFLVFTLVALAVRDDARAQQSFPYGVAAGEITASSAVLWTRAPAAGVLSVEVSPTPDFASPLRRTGRALQGNDLTVSLHVTGLTPATRYSYRFRQGSEVSPVGAFVTAPAATTSTPVRFAISGDADATPTATGKPAFNGFQVYGRMAAERNDFNINLGDTIYSDSGVAGPVARTVPEKWAKYRLGLQLAPLRRLRASAGLYSHWDDHEFVNDFSRAEHGAAIYRAGVKAFRDYSPVTYTARTGLYRSFRWGRHLELFFLDERSFRSAKATAVCGGDVAPTAPAAIRAGFTTIAPDLAKPVPQACLDAIASPERTILGAAQYAAFVRAVQDSNATFKVIVNEVPMLQFYVLPYDRWEGYAAERTRLLEILKGVGNVVVLTTDTHAHLIGEIRTQTLEPGGPVGTGIWEVVTGPVATNTYGKEVDEFLGAPGTAVFVGGLFLKPPPPRGLGLACAALDTYGYAEVEVTATALTVTPKDIAGRRVRDVNGTPCAPLVVRAR
jgi:phosphodiesterase/alkaline phosphatase D-like protein